ncbi:MAG: cellulose biosynthesis cyclic di-GMP-binding regulatory protein BcsB [Burkholderiales bacterium]
MKLKNFVAIFILAAGLLGAVAAPALTSASALALPPPAQATVEPTVDTASLPSEIRRISFAKLGQPVIRLRTATGRGVVSFGTRADELVTKASLKLRYTYSPALIPGLSHIKVLLNDEIVSVIPITRENAGRSLTQELDIDPRLITDFNKITLDFVGHYINECEDPLHTSLWADISGASELQLTVRPVLQKSDLARLPEPFFDPRDFNRLNLPFIFSAKPSKATLRASAITASWFGKLAGWRGARFAAYLDAAPKGHAVVFATNAERPGFLSKAAPFAGPGLSILTNPGDGYSKLLLVSGRDGDDLKMAANALVLGNAALSGTQAAITKPHDEALRRAYDAPNWVRMDRPMKFGELVESAQQLQLFGHRPDPVRLNLRMPPDLFTWRSRGVPFDLKYRYTPPIRASESRLVMSINDELVQAVNLRSAGQGDEPRLRVPLLDGDLVAERQNVMIPPFKLAPRNQMQFAFSFTYQKEDACRDTQVENVRAIIDSDSTIDFSGFPHYAEMPHLGYFATAGFPFTKYADLAQTVVVLPEVATAQDISVMLTLLGRMGESTGYPATQVSVVGPKDQAAFKDRDLLLIGAAPSQSLLDQWGEQLPALITGDYRRISQPVRSVSFLYDWLGFGTEPDPAVATQEVMRDHGPLAALLGFESPVTSSRSVVAVTAAQAPDLLQILDVLDDDGLTKAMHGSAVFVRSGKVDSVLAGNTYTIGSLPFWTIPWFALMQRPILLAFVSFLAGVLLLYALWRMFKAVAKFGARDDE